MKPKLVEERGIQDIFAVKTGYTPAEGDVVVLSGDKEVTKASLGSPFALGRIIVNSNGVVNFGKVTVRTDFGSLVNKAAGENLITGPVVLGGDDKVYQYSKVTANGKLDLTIANVADGSTTMTATIDGVAITISLPAAQSANDTAAALTAAINANAELLNKGFYATVSSAVVSINSDGKINDGVAVTVATTDGTQTISGAGSISGGAGYPTDAVYGLCVQSTLADADAPVLTKE